MSPALDRRVRATGDELMYRARVFLRVRTAVAAVIVLGAVWIPASRVGVAGAASPSGQTLSCSAAGSVDVTSLVGGRWAWTISGGGSCIGAANTPFVTSFAGAGTSQG